MWGGTITIFAIDHPHVEEQQQQPVFKDPSQKPVEDCLVEEIDQVFLFLCLALALQTIIVMNEYGNCTAQSTLLFSLKR